MPRGVTFTVPSGKALVVDVDADDTVESVKEKLQKKAPGGVLPTELRCDWDSLHIQARDEGGFKGSDGFTIPTEKAIEKVLLWISGRTLAGRRGVTTFYDILEPDMEVTIMGCVVSVDDGRTSTRGRCLFSFDPLLHTPPPPRTRS